MLDSVNAHWRAGNKTDATRLVVEYFNRTLAKSFLLDTSWLRDGEAGARTEAERWITGASDDVRLMTRHRLMVYDTPAPPLRPGFPWGGEWCVDADAEDILFRTRPHRFAFAPRCALAVIGEKYSAEEFTALLRDWMTFASSHPHLPFVSTFLVTQRLLASTCALSFLAATPGRDDTTRRDLCVALLQIVEQDVAYIVPGIGTAYPNNHLLTERFAGWFIATVYPACCDGRIVLEEAENLWLAELYRQTYDDGGSIEHAVNYHGLATELAVGYFLLTRKNDAEIQPRHAERIRRMLRLQADLSGPDGNAPGIGDGTDDPMFPLDRGSGTTPGAMREIYRSLFAPAIPPLVSQHPANERAFWLLKGNHSRSKNACQSSRFSQYPDSGVFIYFEHEEATRCIFRTGPVADMLNLAGHMHADLLSVCLIYKNAPMLVDPGTYSYVNTPSDTVERPNWREYFSGPHAHNGVVVDRQDPLGPVVGNFRIGSSSASVRHTIVTGGERLSLVEARIISPPDYADIGRGVIHVREEYFLIYNSFASEASTRELFFPLQLDHLARVRSEQGNVINVAGARDEGIAIVYSDELLLVERNIGRTTPPRGWISRQYGEIVAATQFVFRSTEDSDASSFALCFNPEAPVLRITSHRVSKSAHAFRASGPDFCDYVLVNAGSTNEPISWFGIEFIGRLLWLRVSRSRRTQVRAIDILSCKGQSFGVDLGFETVRREIHEI